MVCGHAVHVIGANVPGAMIGPAVIVAIYRRLKGVFFTNRFNENRASPWSRVQGFGIRHPSRVGSQL